MTSIGYSAFHNCKNSITNYLGDIESWCKIEFSSDESNPYYNGKFFVNGEEVENIVIPETVTEIKKHTFSGFSNLTSITIPNSVTNIGNRAFYNCSSLTNIIIPNGVINIGDEAFCNCKNLTSVNISDSVKNIGIAAFMNCSSLKRITISNSITNIGSSAFTYCKNLTTIDFNGTMSEWKAITKGSGWNSVTGDYTVYCTDGKLDKNDNEITD